MKKNKTHTKKLYSFKCKLRGMSNGFWDFSLFAWDKKIENIWRTLHYLCPRHKILCFLFMLLKMIKEMVDLGLRGWCMKCWIPYFVLVGRERKLCVSNKRMLKYHYTCWKNKNFLPKVYSFCWSYLLICSWDM